MLILQSFFNNSMLVDCLLLCFVSKLAFQLSYWGTWIQEKDFVMGQEWWCWMWEERCSSAGLSARTGDLKTRWYWFQGSGYHLMQRHLPVLLKRLQFPVRLAFAMTINKSQGQSVEHVGINLQTSVFSHGQLYVAFSRCTSPLNISVLLPEQSQESRRTLNVVYKEVFNSIRL